MSAPGKKGPVIAVVGPSGVGKDSLMSALAVSGPQLRLMRRVVTRAPEAGGEDYQAVSEVEFAALAGSWSLFSAALAGARALLWHSA